MNLPKPTAWIAGIAIILSGTLLIYLEKYKNNQAIDGVSFVLLFVGWITLFTKATKGTSVDTSKILFKDDKAGWFKQRISNFFYYITLIALIFGNGYYAIEMAYARKQEILANGPTKTAVAQLIILTCTKVGARQVIMQCLNSPSATN